MTDRPPAFDAARFASAFAKVAMTPTGKRSWYLHGANQQRTFTEPRTELEPLSTNGPGFPLRNLVRVAEDRIQDASQDPEPPTTNATYPAPPQSPSDKSTSKKSFVNGYHGDRSLIPSDHMPESPSSVNRPSRKTSYDTYPHATGLYRFRRALVADTLEFLEPGQENNGLVGLQNFGNTCYMNSALQCLLHNPTIKEYFLSGAYRTEANPNNVLGTNGVLLEHLADFFRVFFTVKSKEISPFRLKKEIDNFNQTFEAYRQHDAQEFFNYLLDVIHEDSNRVIKRPYLQNVEGKAGEDDADVARRSWVQYLRLNDSLISRFFIGQFKNHTRCPDPACHHETTTFDPFTILSLSIPAISRKELPLKYILEGGRQIEVLRLALKSLHSFADITCEQVLTAFAALKGIPRERLWCCTFSSKNFTERLPPTSLLEDVIPKIKRMDCLGILQVSEESHRASLTPDCIWVNIDITWANRSPDVVEEFDEEYPQTQVITRLICLEANATIKDMMVRIVQLLLPHSTLMSAHTEYPDDLAYYEGHLKLMNEDRPDRRFFDVCWEKIKLDRVHYAQPLRELVGHDDPDVYVRVDIYPRSRTSVLFDFQRFMDVDMHFHSEMETLTVTQPADWTVPEQLTLPALLASFSHTEILDASNKWMCPGCRQEVHAEKTISIYKAPRYLTIHFKKIKTRYAQVQNVTFDLDLDMSTHVLSPSTVADYHLQPEEYLSEDLMAQLTQQGRSLTPSWHTTEHPSPRYRLYAVVYHIGRQNYGHYTVACRLGDQWFEFNDEAFAEMPEDQVCNEDAYLLLYERV